LLHAISIFSAHRETLMPDADNSQTPPRKSQELKLFLFIILLLFPLLAIAVVGGYGFIVWMMQIVTGPPGPPS
jgi:nitrate reductase NapE